MISIGTQRSTTQLIDLRWTNDANRSACVVCSALHVGIIAVSFCYWTEKPRLGIGLQTAPLSGTGGPDLRWLAQSLTSSNHCPVDEPQQFTTHLIESQ